MQLVPMRVGIFLPNWIGDVVMATPAIRAIHEQLGEGGALVGIMRPYVAEVLAGTAWLDEELLYEKLPRSMIFANRGLFAKLRTARLDRIVLLTNSLRTAWMAWRSGAAERIGYTGEGRSWMLTTRVRRPRRADRTPLPTIDGYLQVAAAAGYPSGNRQLELSTTPADEAAADQVWHRLGLPLGEHVVMLNSGGAYGAAKSWPVDHFAELARRIVAGGNDWVLVNCGPAERDIARQIASRAAHPKVRSLAEFDPLPIGLTKACVRRSRLVVSTDSGPRFMAVAFEKPVVSLFGPTNPLATKTFYPHETSLSLQLDCQPCMQRVCPLAHHRCMRELTVDRVWRTVEEHLKVPLPRSKPLLAC